MNRYIFPAVFEPGDKAGYCVTFPDLPGCITEGDTLQDTLTMARDALELHLYGLEADYEDIPQPSDPSRVEVPRDAFVTLVEANMSLIRSKMSAVTVKKTLTLPKWLNDLAEDQSVNFSQALQKSLRQLLKV